MSFDSRPKGDGPERPIDVKSDAGDSRDSTVLMQRGDSDALTRLHDEIWRSRGHEIGVHFPVTPCPFTSDELLGLYAAGRRVSYLPPSLATRATRHLLAALFPLLRSYGLLADNAVTNDKSPSGWFDYESAIDASLLDLDEVQTLAAASEDGRALLSLNQYIVASQDTKFETGKYLDENGTWVRVSSRVDGRLVTVRVDGPQLTVGRSETPVEGCLLIAYDVGAADRFPVLGARTTSASNYPRNLVDDDESPFGYSFVAPRNLKSQKDVETEWRRLASIFVTLDFHSTLDLDVASYLASLPKAPTQPKVYRGRFDIPLLVETRIPWQRQAELAGISLSVFSQTAPYRPFDQRSALPEQPYGVWSAAWGQRFPDAISPGDARADLKVDEVGGNLNELIAMQIAHPEFNSTGRFFDAIGYVMPAVDLGLDGSPELNEVERTPGMCQWRGSPEIGANLHPVAFSMFRPLVRGAQIY
jgi:hypothetical protein